jgi:hypothetical protein
MIEKSIDAAGQSDWNGQVTTWDSEVIRQVCSMETDAMETDAPSVLDWVTLTDGYPIGTAKPTQPLQQVAFLTLRTIRSQHIGRAHSPGLLLPGPSDAADRFQILAFRLKVEKNHLVRTVE